MKPRIIGKGIKKARLDPEMGILFFFFFGCAGSLLLHGLSPVVVHGFLTGVAYIFFFFFFTVNVKTLGHFYLCLVLAALGARCCMQAFCSCGECG